MMKHKIMWTILAGVIGVGVVVSAIGGVVRLHAKSAPSAAGDPGESRLAQRGVIQVKVVHPKPAPHGFARTVTQPAYVRAYYQANLMAHVAGPVKYIQKNIGDPIRAGEVLVKLDVPELEEDVVQKQAMRSQTEQEVRAAEAYLPIAEAADKQARATIKVKETEVERAAATRKFRWSEYQRFKTLASGPSPAVTAGVVEERLRDYEAADADWKAAQATVLKAKAAEEEFHSKVEAARVDIKTKQSQVVVAAAELARSQALLGYAKIRAPFDGIIVARHVDPGTFVQNASTGQPAPVLTVVRTNVVTAVMWVPEKDAPYVTRNTDATLRFDALGKRVIRAKVTRLSHWLDPDKSRDMRVEVDLWNAPAIMSPATYSQALAGSLAPLAATGPPQAAALLAAREQLVPANWPLKPGMYGTMKLVLQRFDNADVIPEGAIFERNGRTCIFEVVDGTAHLVPVQVELDDGIRAKIVKLIPHVDPATEQTEFVKEELTGKEDIIPSDQGEIADGQAVQAIPGKW